MSRLAISKIYSNSKILYFSAIFIGVILSTGSILPMMSNVQAQPAERLIERFNQEDVPPGLTRVTIIHGIDENRIEIDHGPGKVPPPFQKQESFECTNGAGTDECDTNTWRGHQWPNLPVEYSVNLAKSGDDVYNLAAVNAGIQTWEDDPDSSFDATFLGTSNKKTSTTEPRGRMDGSNVIGWGSTSHFGVNIIAVVSWFYYTSTGNIVEADMRFNKDLAWSTNGGPDAIDNPDSTLGDPNSFDLQAIATHEGGHFVAGLIDIYHSSESELTMYGYGAKGELHPRTLGVGDQLSIAAAYPPTTPITPPTLQEISVTPADTSISVGSTQQYTATGTYSDLSTADITNQVTWTSSDSSVATIDTAGLALAASEEMTTISATSGALVGSTTLTVTTPVPPPPSGSTAIVGPISYTTEGGKYQDKHLYITIHVANDLGNSVNGASVSIKLDNSDTSQSWTASATTGSNGNIVFTLKNSPGGCYTTTITGVSASGLTWDGETPANSKCK